MHKDKTYFCVLERGNELLFFNFWFFLKSLEEKQLFLISGLYLIL